MIRVRDYNHLLEKIAIVKAYKEGYITNFYLEKLKVLICAERGMLGYILYGRTLFIVKEEELFASLYYCSTSLEQLETDLIVLNDRFANKDMVTDIIGNISAVESIKEVFLKKSFQHYVTLQRMVSMSNDYEMMENSIVTHASEEEVKDVFNLLNLYFDARCEQIPFLEELSELVKSKRILVIKEKKAIAGFLIYTLTGATSCLRYWYTHPDYRDNKIGSKLFRKFIEETRSTRRRLFWVIEDNENAIKRYLHYGFRHENMYDKVLIRYKRG